jgi:HEAT repeat protein
MMSALRILALAAIGVASAYGQGNVDALVQSISSDDGDTRLSAFDDISLGQVGVDAIGPVAGLLDHPSVAIAGDARIALERIAGPLTAEASTREAASSALCRAVQSAEKRSAQRWLLWLLSYTGGAEAVPHLIGLLDNESTFDLALFAIQSIGGDAGAMALSERMKSATSENREAYIDALEKIGGKVAVDALIAEVKEDSGESAISAIEALGALGVIEAEPALWSQLTARGGTMVLSSYLRLAEQQPPAVAATFYEKLLTLPGDSVIRCAALSGLGKTGSANAVEAIVPLLISQRADVYGTAQAALVAMEDDGVTDTVRRLMADSDTPVRAALLEVLYNREPETALAEVEAALDDSNSEVRATAVRLLAESANPKYESALRELATSGAAEIRPVALRGYLGLAGAALAHGEESQALAMYHRAIEIATEDSERREALRGLGSIGSIESFPYLERVGGGPALKEDLEACALAIASNIRQSDPDAARNVLRRILEQSKYVDLAQRAATALRVMGDDVNVAPKLGFIIHWQIIGPFPNTGFDTVYPPEGEFKPDAQYAGIEGATLGWQDYVIDHVRGIAELDTFLRPKDDIIAYARTVITVPSTQEAELRLGSDDGVVCWLNGEQVHRNKVDRKVSVDHDRVPVTLRSGENVLLLKIVQGGGGMGYCARFFGKDGIPLRVREAR